MRRLLAGAATAAALAVPAAAHAGAVHLRVRSDDRAGHVRHAQLHCTSDGPRATGFLRHRDAAKLCARAYQLERFLSRPPRHDQPCTMVYGGPDRARIRGNVRGAAVDRSFSRANGCEIADWDRAQLLLPRPSNQLR